MKISLLSGPWWAEHGEWAGLSSLPPNAHREGYWLNTNATSVGSLTCRTLPLEASHLELWGWGGGEEGAALVIGRAVWEDKEEEEETGRGEELLQPSENTWALSTKQTEGTQRIQTHNKWIYLNNNVCASRLNVYFIIYWNILLGFYIQHTFTWGVGTVGQVGSGIRCVSPRETAVVFITMVMVWCQREAGVERKSSASSRWAQRPIWDEHTHVPYLIKRSCLSV